MILPLPRCGFSRRASARRRFIGAGGDLLIVGDASLATTIADAIKDEAADDPDFAKRVTESAARVVAMKERRGLARC